VHRLPRRERHPVRLVVPEHPDGRAIDVQAARPIFKTIVSATMNEYIGCAEKRWN
jgi:hypothetical protein